eukprot:218438-Rhodomonas_salina.4
MFSKRFASSPSCCACATHALGDVRCWPLTAPAVRAISRNDMPIFYEIFGTDVPISLRHLRY